jgi:hypothetical protein
MKHTRRLANAVVGRADYRYRASNHLKRIKHHHRLYLPFRRFFHQYPSASSLSAPINLDPKRYRKTWLLNNRRAQTPILDHRTHSTRSHIEDMVTKLEAARMGTDRERGMVKGDTNLISLSGAHHLYLIWRDIRHSPFIMLRTRLTHLTHNI